MSCNDGGALINDTDHAVRLQMIERSSVLAGLRDACEEEWSCCAARALPSSTAAPAPGPAVRPTEPQPPSGNDPRGAVPRPSLPHNVQELIKAMVRQRVAVRWPLVRAYE